MSFVTEDGVILYEQGDTPDPTFGGFDGTRSYDCPAVSPDGWGFECTWDAGHSHPQHIAGTSARVARVWEDNENV